MSVSNKAGVSPGRGVTLSAGGSAATTRYFATLASAQGGNYPLTTPWIATGDFRITCKCSTSSASGHIIISGGTGPTGFEIFKGTNGKLNIYYEGVPIGSGAVLNIQDGKLNVITATRVGSAVQVYINGVADVGATISGPMSISIAVAGRRLGATSISTWDGVMADILLEDLSGPFNTFTFPLGLVAAGVETALEGGNSLTYTNITDISEYRLNGNQWEELTSPFRVIVLA